VSVVTSQPKKVWTEEDLQKFPDNGYRIELVDGELVTSPKNNFEHENVCARLFLELANFNRQHRLGVVVGSNLGCWMHNRNCRAPDISFISKERIKQIGFTPSTRRFLPSAPDLTVEVVSPSNTRAEIESRLRDFFSSGTQLAWIIHPDEQFVEVCHSIIDRTIVGPGAHLEGEHLLPGFRCAISDLFGPWEWD